MEQEKSSVRAVALAIIITAIVVGSGVYLWQKNQTAQPKEQEKSSAVTTPIKKEPTTPVATMPTKEEPTEPLSYSTGGVSVSVSKKVAPFDYTSEELNAMAQGCDYKQSNNYFDQLVSKFNSTSKIVYNFKYTGATKFPELNTYTITLLPNSAGYTSLEQFKKDFSVCEMGGGGDGSPKMFNSNWLLFANSCGNGLDDGSGRWDVCNMVKNAVDPTLKLN